MLQTGSGENVANPGMVRSRWTSGRAQFSATGVAVGLPTSSVSRQNIAMGLIGEPEPPGTARGAAVTKNAQRLRLAAS